jgi:hypothetical protein
MRDAPATLACIQPGSSSSPLRAAQRLWLARALAWALLLGGWLALGTLGRQHLPGHAAGQGLVTLWLLSIGLTLALASRWYWRARPLQAALLLLGVLAAVAMFCIGRSGLALPLAALASGALLVAASFTVRALRPPRGRTAPSPVGPAVAGAVLAWALVGSLGATPHAAARWGLALVAAACLLASLLPRAAAAHGACRSGLFDCSSSLPVPAHWRRVADWPPAAAALGMLPMMASLPAMADWCGAQSWSQSTASAAHLCAMLLPALLLRRAASLRQPAATIGLLLALGGLAFWLPGASGLMAAALVHGVAWSVAWGEMLKTPRAGNAPNVALPASLWAPWLATAGFVLLLGVAVDQLGPPALAAVHAVLAGLGGAGLAAIALRHVWRASSAPSPA